MICLGAVPAGTTIYIPFTTYAGSTGASATCSGLAVTDIEIYKNGSTTQRSSDAGYALLDTDGIDFDGITGLHGFSIDLNDNTDSGFFAVGSWYWVVVSAITVDSQTVTFLAAVFRIAPAETSTGVPKVDVSHAAGTAWASGAITAASIASSALTAAKFDTACLTSAKFDAGAITSTVVADGFITSAKFAAGAIDNAAIATDAIGSAELAASAINEIVDQVWDESNSAHGIPGSTGEAVGLAFYNTENRLPAVLVSGRIDASVGAMASGVLTATAIAADAITAAKVDVGVHQELIELAFTYNATADYATATAGSLVKEIADNAGGSGLTAAAIADAVWDEAIAGHVSSGSTGESLNAAGGAGDPWITALPGAYSAGSAGYIIGTNLNATVSSRASQTSVDTVDDFLDTEIAAIKSKTDNLPTDPADQSAVESAITAATTGLATAASLATVAGYLDTEIAAILADTNELQTDWANGGRLDVILDARASQTSVDDVPTNAELAAAITTALTTALTEGYRATNATGSVRDLLYEILQNITEFTISSTTKTVKKLDGSTTAKTYTLNDGTTPTGITEAT